MIKISTKILHFNKMNKPAKLFYSYFKKKKWVSNITSQILVHALPEEKTNELIFTNKKFVASWMATMGSWPAPWVYLPPWIYICFLKGIPTYSEWLALFDILRLKSLNSC